MVFKIYHHYLSKHWHLRNVSYDTRKRTLMYYHYYRATAVQKIVIGYKKLFTINDFEPKACVQLSRSNKYRMSIHRVNG